MAKFEFRFEHKITILYIVLGGLWIIFSDRLALMLFNDPETLSRVQTYKGWIYVLITATVFFSILRWYILNLRKSQEKAEESDRLKTAFLQNISHEIRTPMNSICGFSSLINKDGLTSEKRKLYSDIIAQNSNQLLSIVDDILSMSNIETGQGVIRKQSVFLDKVTQSLFDHYLPIAKAKNIDLIAKGDPNAENIILKTDEEKFKQILWNLLSNAIKFTHEGEVMLGYSLKSNFIEFFIKDTGIGISPENQNKIFNRFVQADPSIQLRYGGTGLGLSIAKAYTELLGGSIRVESEPNVGTTFYFTLPFEHSDYVQLKNTRDNEVKNSSTKQTILVAEDEEYNYMYLEAVLMELQVTLIRAKNGQEAVDICSNNPKIDLVIMDIRMPIMNGFEASTIIKKLRPSLPIIAHTAYTSRQDEIKAKSIGVDEYLPKPLNEKKLLKLLEKYRR
ncbi:MAG: hybrid sensor histidine kinase/response regulator [Bacteroidetes bacterium HGW-Bacteroidetes-15]|nr:MAG: hybrid sensor histidine kinase/response regulator [Bacteroidetes bacterium HGW-Bacteroidetes-15]